MYVFIQKEALFTYRYKTHFTTTTTFLSIIYLHTGENIFYLLFVLKSVAYFNH